MVAEVCDRGHDEVTLGVVVSGAVDNSGVPLAFVTVEDDDGDDDDEDDDAGTDSSRLCFAGMKKFADALSLRFKLNFCSCSG